MRSQAVLLLLLQMQAARNGFGWWDCRRQRNTRRWGAFGVVPIDEAPSHRRPSSGEGLLMRQEVPRPLLARQVEGPLTMSGRLDEGALPRGVQQAQVCAKCRVVSNHSLWTWHTRTHQTDSSLWREL